MPVANQSEELYSLGRIPIHSIEYYSVGEFAEAQSEEIYSLNKLVAAQIEELFSLRVAAQNEEPFSIKVSIQLEEPIHDSAISQLEENYSIRVAVGFVEPVNNSIAQQIEEIYSLNNLVAQQIEETFDLLVFNPVAVQSDESYAINVSAQSEEIYSLNPEVAAQLEEQYSMTISVAAQTEESFDLLALNPVASQSEERYDLVSAPAIVITAQPYILFEGKEIQIKTASISSDESSFIWDAEIELARVEDYSPFKQDDPIELNLLGESYSLIVVNKNMNRVGGGVNSPVSISMSLTASSPSIQHAFPRATGITKTWDVATLAKDIAEEVTGEAIDWQLVDWYIPAGKFSVINAAPISIVQQLVEAAGGVVESKKDGSLLVRHAFPVSVKDWAAEAPDQSYSDIADNLSVSEQYSFIDRYNKVLITDGFDESSADSIEYVKDEDTGLAGVIRVYPNPYRAVELYHTSLNHIGLSPQGEVIRTEVGELLEFKGGKAITSYPIHSIESVDWKYDDLGSPSFTADKKELSAPDGEGYSLALVTYKTRSYNFRVTSPIEEAVQFIIRGS